MRHLVVSIGINLALNSHMPLWLFFIENWVATHNVNEKLK